MCLFVRLDCFEEVVKNVWKWMNYLIRVLEKAVIFRSFSACIASLCLSNDTLLSVMVLYVHSGQKFIIIPNTLGCRPKSIIRKHSFPWGSYKESIDKLVLLLVSCRGNHWGFIISLCIDAICCIVDGQWWDRCSLTTHVYTSK